MPGVPSIGRVSAVIRRNLLSVLFPVGVSWAIFTDLSRTRAHKARKASALQAGPKEELSS